MATTYTITIGGVDRTACIYNKTVDIFDESRNSPSTMNCDFLDRDAVGVPSLDDEIIITLDGTIIFAGHIIALAPKKVGSGVVKIRLQCLDYNRVLDRNLVAESYIDKTDQYIITDIISKYTKGTGITITGLTGATVTIEQISFNYMSPSECLSRICDLTGRSWYIDYEKDIHYFPITTTTTPFDIDTDENRYWDLEISKDNSQIRNRVYVRGGTYLSNEVTTKFVADGEQVIFNLPDKPSAVTVKEGAVEKTLGIKNIDESTDYDYLLNFQEKYIEASAAPAADVVVSILFKYYIPVLVAVEDATSIAASGIFEYIIFDNSIKNLQQARDRAAAELTDFADSIIDGKFYTRVNGFIAGQYININISDLDIDDDYYVQTVRATSLGAGEFIYEISVGEANKVGIIKFLINLIEQDKNALGVTDDEAVDELLEVTADGVEIDDDPSNNITLTDKEPPYLWGSFKWGLAEWNST